MKNIVWGLTFSFSFFVFFLIASQAEAGIFGPSNKQECIQKYITKTQTDYAAMIVGDACRDLFYDFKSYTFQAYLNDVYGYQFNQYGVRRLDDPLDPKKARMIDAYLAGLELERRGKKLDRTPDEKKRFDAIINPLLEDFESYKKEKKAEKKKKAECLLELDDLYEAKNKIAAMNVYSNSECVKR